MSTAAVVLSSAMALLGACGNTGVGDDQGRPEAYFESGTFSAQPEADAAMAQRLSEALRLMGELPLRNGVGLGAALRVVALPTFGRPRAIRLEGLDTSTPRLFYAQLTGRGGYELGQLAARREALLQTPQAATLREHADSLRQRLSEQRADDVAGNDGTTWLVETRTNEDHTARTIWTPDSRFGPTLRAILSAAGDECTECR